MARTTPQVIADQLAVGEGQAPIAVGSAGWFAWL